jgi:hypothetical protein
MLTREENDLLTYTGPGTPGGALLRRYWQPVALSEELPENGAPLLLHEIHFQAFLLESNPRNSDRYLALLVFFASHSLRPGSGRR